MSFENFEGTTPTAGTARRRTAVARLTNWIRQHGFRAPQTHDGTGPAVHAAVRLAAAAAEHQRGESPVPGTPNMIAAMESHQHVTGPLSASDPWKAARGLADLAQATIHFLQGDLQRTPMHHGPPDPETAPLIPALVQLNSAGFVTIDSQPGYADPSWTQRAYVEGLCSKSTADQINDSLLRTDLIVMSFKPTETAWTSITVTIWDDRPHTFVGGWDSHVLTNYSNGHPELDAELVNARALQIVDPVWGRNDELWPRLVNALA
jgi:hypothetical protein